MSTRKSSCATRSVFTPGVVSLPAAVFGFTKVSVSRHTTRMANAIDFFAVKPVSQSTAGGKLTDRRSLYAYCVASIAASFAFLAFIAPSANASVAASPGWSISSFASPSTFAAADNALCVEELGSQSPKCDQYEVTVRNTGKLATETNPLTLEPVPTVLTDTVPAGLEVKELKLFSSSFANGEFNLAEAGLCTTTPTPGAPTSVVCSYPGPFPSVVPPDGTLKLQIFVTVGTG